MKLNLSLKSFYLEDHSHHVYIDDCNDNFGIAKLIHDYLVDNRYVKNHDEITSITITNGGWFTFETCLPDGMVFTFKRDDF